MAPDSARSKVAFRAELSFLCRGRCVISRHPASVSDAAASQFPGAAADPFALMRLSFAISFVFSEFQIIGFRG